MTSTENNQPEAAEPMSSLEESAARDADIHWPSVLQFSLSTIALIGLWGVAISGFTLGVTQLLTSPEQKAQATQSFLLAFGIGFTGVLILPSVGFSLMRLMRREIKRFPRLQGITRKVLMLAPLIIPVVVILGDWAARTNELTWLVLPPMHLIAVGLPVGWLLWLGIRGLPKGSLQRSWGVFNSGMLFGPFLILILEIMALIALAVIAIIYVSRQPDLAAELTRMADRIYFEGADTENALNSIGPFLLEPGVILMTLIFTSVIVPLIEELLKPIGVWLLASRDLTPAEGFAAGLLSGAGYALFESMILSSNAGDWSSLVVARIGTSLLHIITTGLTGWALVLAWREKRYLRLGVVYLLSVVMHALWNGVVVVNTFSALALELDRDLPPFFEGFLTAIPISLGAITLLMFILLRVSNKRLVKDDGVGESSLTGDSS
jgi:hypothetical protein